LVLVKGARKCRAHGTRERRVTGTNQSAPKSPPKATRPADRVCGPDKSGSLGPMRSRNRLSHLARRTSERIPMRSRSRVSLAFLALASSACSAAGDSSPASEQVGADQAALSFGDPGDFSAPLAFTPVANANTKAVGTA